MIGLFALDREILFNTRNAAEIHVLCNLYGIGAPRRNHFTAGAYKPAFQRVSLFKLGTAIKPAQFFHFVLRELVIYLSGNHALLRSCKKQYHIVVRILMIFDNAANLGKKAECAKYFVGRCNKKA